MSVLLETTLGNLVIDLDFNDCKVESYNFLKLCKSGFYQYQCFFNLQRDYSVDVGDALIGNEYREELRYHNNSINGIIGEQGQKVKLVKSSKQDNQKIEVTFGDVCAQIAVSTDSTSLIGSKVIIALCQEVVSQDNMVKFGSVIEECHQILRKMNMSTVDEEKRPQFDIRIIKAHILHDPFPDPPGLTNNKIELPVETVRLDCEPLISLDEDIDIRRDIRQKELTLEIMGDIPHIGITPSEKVLFICKLNPITVAKDIAMIFHRFGEILSVEIIRDKDTGASLSYGFIEFSTKKSCELAYSKMEGVVIDDRRIHVDFCQSAKSVLNNITRI